MNNLDKITLKIDIIKENNKFTAKCEVPGMTIYTDGVTAKECIKNVKDLFNDHVKHNPELFKNKDLSNIIISTTY